MGEIRGEKWHGLGWRLPLCALFLLLAGRALGIGCAAGGMIFSLPGLLMAAAALIAAAIMVAPPLANAASHLFIGSFLAGVIFPNDHGGRPPPAYGPAEARRMEGLYEESIQAYEAILAECPADGRCYLALMDIAWRDLHDARRAMGFYQRASAAVKDKAYRQEMRHAYEDFAPGLIEQYQFSMPRPTKPSTPTRHYLDE